MRQARPSGARLLLAVSMFATSAFTAACSDEEDAICACDEPRRVVFVDLGDAPIGGSVEACHEDHCETAPVEQADASDEIAEVAIPYDDFAGWSAETPSELSFTVRDDEGEVIAESAVTPERRKNCCGEYLQVEL